MHKTGIEEYYIIKDNKKMHFGYTTGSCAAAAAKAATLMLYSGKDVASIPLHTPKGIDLDLEILDITRSEDGKSVSCAVRKDGGDDPDATHGTLIYANVTIDRSAHDGELIVDGGKGVGRVTLAGMKQAIGEAAINPVPMQMIRTAVESVREDFDGKENLKVIISVPEGEEIASHTFNPRLGIVGGISILGTTGIVEPMSIASLLASIELEMSMLREKGHEYLVVTPGNYGDTFTKESMDIDLTSSLQCSNYVGDTLNMAVNKGIKGILFVGHVGKFIKVAGGIMNTHSHWADARAEMMAGFALRAGADADTARRILDTITTDEALDILEEAGIRRQAMDLAAEKAKFYLQFHVGKAIQTEVIMFSSKYGYLCQSDGVDEMLKHFEK